MRQVRFQVPAPAFRKQWQDPSPDFDAGREITDLAATIAAHRGLKIANSAWILAVQLRDEAAAQQLQRFELPVHGAQGNARNAQWRAAAGPHGAISHALHARRERAEQPARRGPHRHGQCKGQ